ncbi:MAG TPA: ABC-2 family transporter protein [Frankiaceae bacterium]|nr:ABC-2 family transporter protein [Frankiaceae bacterium]
MRGLAATMRGAFAEAWSNRAGFWAQAAAMVVNDVAWVGFWVLFFGRVGAVRGWDREGVLVMLAILTTAGGVVLGLFANTRSLGRLAAEGELDAALSLPVPPLAYLLVRRVEAVNIGDLVFGVLLFCVVSVGDFSVARVATYVLGVVVASTVLAGFLITTASVSFFVGRNDVGELSFHSALLFASYPVDVFGGVGKVVLYTVVPTAFMGAVPARLVASFDPVLALVAVGVAVAFAVLGWGSFTLGLRRYASGAVWTRG